ncbi:putative oxidation resistance protein [Clavispora lusitaniae]|uniref:Oxidation resistance protein n=1 Tax=Clavispora lusitaniae TaxID=36911 RepID=A0ACD0WK33_CLALS|nr:oxidation resistance protein 1 [Clavispora lusitaniae]QFZ27902.1 putative oxidation resistance protein [Clavispora lusitaniae]QFZ32791.1 putative oxidation resistance protein [Clavispora lusitaniae]QFZ38461.1 putative oxidation resistance protein [Clavispora lusitaniae]QFZ44143.1 putative oxidation resistance protein [Clavispora lusitaniae]
MTETHSAQNESQDHPTGFHPVRKQPSLISRIIHGPQKPSPPSSHSESPELPALSDLKFTGYSDSTRHRLLDPELAHNIRNLMPPRLQLYNEWELVYSMDQHGISLNTLYRHCDPEFQRHQLKLRKSIIHEEKGYAEDVVKNMVTFSAHEHNKGQRPHGYVMVIQDEKKNRFGCYLNEHLRATDHKRYYGNGECFLWKCEWYDENKRTGSEGEPHQKERFKAFMYTGMNDNMVYSNHDFIAIGSSHGQNGLWLDKALYSGVSYPCETFGNEILNEPHDNKEKYGKFKVMGLEVWRVGALD